MVFCVKKFYTKHFYLFRVFSQDKSLAHGHIIDGNDEGKEVLS